MKRKPTRKRPDLAAKWQDPTFREKMRIVSQSYERTPETREKMAAAKRGARNVRSCPVWVSFRGERKEFASASLAAVHLGVTQQALDLWLRGICKWPGSGKPPQSARAKELIGLRGGYLDGDDDPLEGIL